MATMFDTPLWLCQILILSLFILVVVEADHVSPRAFRGSDFVIANATVQGPSLGLAYVSNLDSNPVVQNAPVFLFARSNSHYTPCYPEGASNADGTGPNPGTSPPVGINPGENCNSPGPYKNNYTRGKPFPVYYSIKQCSDQERRIDYALYYVHDGNLSAGHRHDWEGVTIVYRRVPDVKDEDLWQPHEVVFRQHGKKVHKRWNEIMTVDGESDVRTNTFANKAHPKVYVGFYSHASYPDKCDIGCGDLVNTGPSRYEYRSSDWWRIPSAADLHLYSTIPQEWTTRGPWKHLNNPWSVQHEMCTF